MCFYQTFTTSCPSGIYWIWPSMRKDTPGFDGAELNVALKMWSLWTLLSFVGGRCDSLNNSVWLLRSLSILRFVVSPASCSSGAPRVSGNNNCLLVADHSVTTLMVLWCSMHDVWLTHDKDHLSCTLGSEAHCRHAACFSSVNASWYLNI